MWGMCGLESSRSLDVRWETDRHQAAWREQTIWTVSLTGLAQSHHSSLLHVQTSTHPLCLIWFQPSLPCGVSFFYSAPLLHRRHQHLPPNDCDYRPGQEIAREIPPAKGCRSWRYQPWQPAVFCPATPLQPEPQSGENTVALEDGLSGSCPEEVDFRPRRLSTSCPHLSCDEGAGETGLGPSKARVKALLDPLQFAYQPYVGVNDTVIYLLQVDGAEHNSCKTFTIYFACSCKHTQAASFTQSHAYHTFAVSSCGFKPSISTVMLNGICYIYTYIFFLFCLCTCRSSWRFSAWFPHRGRTMFFVWFLQSS